MPDTPTPLTAGLHTDGPRDPEYTIAVAELISEAVRVLNRHTFAATSGALEYVGQAGRVVDALASAAHRLPQLLKQIDNWAMRFDWEHDIYTTDPRGSAGTKMSVASIALDRAVARARELAAALDEAAQALSTIGHVDPKESNG